MALSAPEPLSDRHQLDDFNSGTLALDDWLRRRARTNQIADASRTFILCDGEKVAGYYALASGAVDTANATGRFRRNMPNPIPVAVLARLAIDQSYQKRGLGRALVQDGASRVLHAAGAIGIRGMIVHAISEEARAFYLALGFDPSPLDPMILMVTLTDLRPDVSR